MKIDIPSGKMIKCDRCECAFVPRFLSKREGVLEYTFFRCEYCGKAYMVSVTDETLRNSIAEYRKLAERNAAHRLTVHEQLLMQELKKKNVLLEKVLRKAYIKDGSDAGE